MTLTSSCRAITPSHGIVPNCVHWSLSQKDRGFVSFHLLQGITNFFHEFSAQCTGVWAYTCIKQKERPNSFTLDMHTFPPSGTDSSTRFPAEGLQLSPLHSLGKLCWLNAGVKAFPSIIQLHSVRTTAHSRWVPTTSREHHVTSSTSLCSFSVHEVMFQFLITSL